MWSYGVFGRTIDVNYASDLKEAIKLKHDFLIKDIEILNRILKKFDGEVAIAVASDKLFNERQKAIKVYVTYSYYTKTSNNIALLISDVSKKLKMTPIIVKDRKDLFPNIIGGQKLKMTPIIVKDRKDLFPNIIGGQKKIMKKLYDEFKYSKYSRIFQEEIIYSNESFKEFLYAYALTNNWI